MERNEDASPKYVRFFKRIVQHSWFTRLIMVLILLNTVMLAMESHDDSLCDVEFPDHVVTRMCMPSSRRSFLEKARPPDQTASWSVWCALLAPKANPGSLYRRGISS